MAILCLGIFLHLVPIYIVLITSLKSASEVLHFPPTWFPQEPTLAAWRLVGRSQLSATTRSRCGCSTGRCTSSLLNSVFIATFTLAHRHPDHLVRRLRQ